VTRTAEPSRPNHTGGGNVLERAKELDFEQRSRLRSVRRVTLTLSFLRLIWRRFWGRTLAAGARAVPHPPAGTVALTLVGHATVMITTPRTRIVTDPMLEPSLWGLPRARAAAVDEGDLDDVGMILISHAHRDHLSLPSLARFPRTAALVVPPHCASLVADLGFARVIELSVGQEFELEDAHVTAVPARHSGTRGFFDQKRRGVNGYVVRAAGRNIYFAGDTGYFAGFLEIKRRFAPDVALLPISGYQPAPFRAEHLSPLDAVYAFEDLGARILIPIAYGSFLTSYEPLDEPLAWLEELARSPKRELTPALTVLGHGQTCLVR
jgi:L-ascorbate metabolism protein UlaG (beta-lactamase superfamily)